MTSRVKLVATLAKTVPDKIAKAAKDVPDKLLPSKSGAVPVSPQDASPAAKPGAVHSAVSG